MTVFSFPFTMKYPPMSSVHSPITERIFGAKLRKTQNLECNIIGNLPKYTFSIITVRFWMFSPVMESSVAFFISADIAVVNSYGLILRFVRLRLLGIPPVTVSSLCKFSFIFSNVSVCSYNSPSSLYKSTSSSPPTIIGISPGSRMSINSTSKS